MEAELLVGLEQLEAMVASAPKAGVEEGEEHLAQPTFLLFTLEVLEEEEADMEATLEEAAETVAGFSLSALQQLQPMAQSMPTEVPASQHREQETLVLVGAVVEVAALFISKQQPKPLVLL